jgi:hypothetical protein
MAAPDNGAQPVTRRQLLLAAGAMAGIQMCYSAQINHGSSALLALGLDEARLSLAWLVRTARRRPERCASAVAALLCRRPLTVDSPSLRLVPPPRQAGPLSGLIVQPIVGVASDACTSPLGKRRPFLIAGGIFTCTALLLFSNARPVASFFVGTGTPVAARTALAVAVFSFFLLDFSIQAIQAPLRALITDIAPGDLLPVGNVYIALFTGLGNLAGSLLASRKLSDMMPVFSNDTQALFSIAALFLFITVSLCVVNVREVPLAATPARVPVAVECSAPLTQPPSAPTRADSTEIVLFERQPDTLRRGERRAARTGESGPEGSPPPPPPPPAPRPASTASFVQASPSAGTWSPGVDDWAAGVPRGHGDTGSVGGSRAALLSRSVRSAVRRSRARLAAGGRPWVFSMLCNAPRPFWRVFAVQLFTWFGFFSLFVFVNAWVGTNVYLGRGSAPEGSAMRELFEDGVRLGGVGNALTALVTVTYSTLLPSLLQRYGVLGTYGFSQLVEATCLITAHFIRGAAGQGEPSAVLKLATVLDIGSFGVVWATTIGVPWSIIGKALNDDPEYQPRIGLFTTVFNVSQSFPQLFVSFGSPFILARFDNDVSAVMFLGGLLALVGAVLVFALRVDRFSDGYEAGFGRDGAADAAPSVEDLLSKANSVTAPSAVTLPAGERQGWPGYSAEAAGVREPFLAPST